MIGRPVTTHGMSLSVTDWGVAVQDQVERIGWCGVGVPQPGWLDRRLHLVSWEHLARDAAWHGRPSPATPPFDCVRVVFTDPDSAARFHRTTALPPWSWWLPVLWEARRTTAARCWLDRVLRRTEWRWVERSGEPGVGVVRVTIPDTALPGVVARLRGTR